MISLVWLVTFLVPSERLRLSRGVVELVTALVASMSIPACSFIVDVLDLLWDWLVVLFEASSELVSVV